MFSFVKFNNWGKRYRCLFWLTKTVYLTQDRPNFFNLNTLYTALKQIIWNLSFYWHIENFTVRKYYETVRTPPLVMR